MKSIAISIGDLNGIGIQLALENHDKISQYVKPIYCIDKYMLKEASEKLGIDIPKNFAIVDDFSLKFDIRPSQISPDSGRYSFDSFIKAIELANEQKVDAICTLPIHKKAWELAGVDYKGHTDALRDIYKEDAIMMLGSPKMYVALFTEHIPLRDVAGSINEKSLTKFLIDFYNGIKPIQTVAVLGLNPHAGDGGVLGDEEKIIQEAIDNANTTIKNSNPKANPVYSDPLVPDIAFTPHIRKQYTHYVAMYHDQGLAPLKALYFDESINVSLNLPILRTSVDHGTAFDIAYTNAKLNNQSYINAIRYIADS